eukprot:725586-Pelagomonas_calceolata.AAC.1
MERRCREKDANLQAMVSLLSSNTVSRGASWHLGVILLVARELASILVATSWQAWSFRVCKFLIAYPPPQHTHTKIHTHTGGQQHPCWCSPWQLDGWQPGGCSGPSRSLLVVLRAPAGRPLAVCLGSLLSTVGCWPPHHGCGHRAVFRTRVHLHLRGVKGVKGMLSKATILWQGASMCCP